MKLPYMTVTYPAMLSADRQPIVCVQPTHALRFGRLNLFMNTMCGHRYYHPAQHVPVSVDVSLLLCRPIDRDYG